MKDIKRLVTVIFVFVFTLVPPDCVYWGMQTRDCTQGLDDIDDVMDAAAGFWPEVEELRDRLDVVCKPSEDLTVSCLDADSVACSLRAGNDLNRAVIYVDDRAPVDVLLGHELLHLVAWQRGVAGGCHDHTPDCWDWGAVKQLQDLGTDIGDCVKGECACEQEDGLVRFSKECLSL